MNKYISVLHGTTPEAIKQIRVTGLDPEYQGSGLGAPDTLDGKKVLSYTLNPDVAKVYSRHSKLLDNLFGSKVDPLIVMIDESSSKEVTPDWVHHEIHSYEKVPVERIIFPGDASYSERLEALRKNRYLEKIAGKTGFKLDLDIQKVVKPRKVTTDEVLPFHERGPISDEDWAHAKFLRDSGDHEGAKEHIRGLTHKTETTPEQRYELSKGFNALLGRWTRVK